MGGQINTDHEILIVEFVCAVVGNFQPFSMSLSLQSST